jgi:YD repeat-containing protein
LPLGSGEFALEEADLRIPGRGFDFELRRKYESQSVYSGPLGWNWDHNYNKRLLELPNGDLLYLDGTGRKERYRANKSEGGIILSYVPPQGYFTECYRRKDGSITIKDERGEVLVFNALGRLAQIIDRNFNKMHFYYDLSGRLSTVMDTMGRLVSFEYYPYEKDDPKSCRLKGVTDFSGRKVIYRYDEETGDLAEVDFEGRVRKFTYSQDGSLKQKHNLLSATDAKGQTYLRNTYDSEDKITSQKYGDAPIIINSGQEAATIDGNGNSRAYVHNPAGNPVSITEGGHTTAYSYYYDDGLIKSIAYPMTNTVDYVYDSTNVQRRTQVNLLSMTRTPDSRGGEPLTTSYTYEPYTNQISSITYPKGNKTEFEVNTSNGNIEFIKYPNGITYQYIYNAYGQIHQEIDPAAYGCNHRGW